MNIRHNKAESCFLLIDDTGRQMGSIIYRKAGAGALFATHTAVAPELEGKGYAGQLVDALVDYARAENLRVVPVCGYVLRKFRDNPQKYAAVFDKEDPNAGLPIPPVL